MDYQSIIDDLVEIAGMRSTSLRKRETCKDAANAITELIARAEEAEHIISDLCDDFTDFVTNGVPNPAPYCANRCPECVDGRGWCNGDNLVCRGFSPKATLKGEKDG